MPDESEDPPIAEPDAERSNSGRSEHAVLSTDPALDEEYRAAFAKRDHAWDVTEQDGWT